VQIDCANHHCQWPAVEHGDDFKLCEWFWWLAIRSALGARNCWDWGGSRLLWRWASVSVSQLDRGLCYFY